MFVVDGSRGRGSPGSPLSPLFAGFFGAPGLFPPQSGVEATGGPSAGAVADHGILGSRGIRFPGVGGTTELALNVLGGLILLAALLVGLSAVPPRVIGRTPIPIQTFLQVRPYLAVFGTTILLSAGLIYGLGTLRL